MFLYIIGVKTKKNASNICQYLGVIENEQNNKFLRYIAAMRCDTIFVSFGYVMHFPVILQFPSVQNIEKFGWRACVGWCVGTSNFETRQILKDFVMHPNFFQCSILLALKESAHFLHLKLVIYRIFYAKYFIARITT